MTNEYLKINNTKNIGLAIINTSEPSQIQKYTHKVLISGLKNKNLIKAHEQILIQSYHYSFPIKISFGNRKRGTSYEDVNVVESANSRRKQGIIRSIYCNFSKYSKFIRLSFAPTEEFDIYDVKECTKRLKNFLRIIRRKYGNVSYLWKFEYGKKNTKRSHFHLVMDLPYIPKEEFHQLWKYGHSRIQAVDSVASLPTYLAKYISKDNVTDQRLFGKKQYGQSLQNAKPDVVYDEDAEKFIKTYADKPQYDPIRYATKFYMKGVPVPVEGYCDYEQYMIDYTRYKDLVVNLPT